MLPAHRDVEAPHICGQLTRSEAYMPLAAVDLVNLHSMALVRIRRMGKLDRLCLHAMPLKRPRIQTPNQNRLAFHHNAYSLPFVHRSTVGQSADRIDHRATDLGLARSVGLEGETERTKDTLTSEEPRSVARCVGWDWGGTQKEGWSATPARVIYGHSRAS